MDPTEDIARRRRGDELESALLGAAWDELVANGYAGLTFEGVAARAATSKPVLYRRWPTKADLVIAAIERVWLARTRCLPDTGSLRDDMLASMRDFNSRRADFIAVLSVLLANLAADTGLSPAHLRERLIGDRVASARVFLERAAARGEIPERDWAPRLVSMPFDLFRHDVLMTLGPVDETRIVEIVDDLWLPLLGGPAQAVSDRALGDPRSTGAAQA